MSIVVQSGVLDVTQNGVTEGDSSGNASGNTSALVAIFGASSGSFNAVYFPPGIYWVGAGSQTPMKLTFSGVTIFGAGSGASTIKVPAPAAGYPLPLIDANGFNGLCVRDIGFVGSGQGLPIGTSPSTQAVINLDQGSTHKVIDCTFTENPSYTIYTTSIDVQVMHCGLTAVGHAGSSGNRTDALLSDATANAARFTFNALKSCNYGGIQVNAANGDASGNYIDSSAASSVWLIGDVQRGVLNCVTNGTSVFGHGPGLYTAPHTQFIMIANSVTSQQDDGFSSAEWRNSVIAANNAITDATTSGDSGIQINSQTSSADNMGLVLLGNNSYNSGFNQNPSVRGLRFFANPAPGPMTHSCLSATTRIRTTSVGQNPKSLTI